MKGNNKFKTFIVVLLCKKKKKRWNSRKVCSFVGGQILSVTRTMLHIRAPAQKACSVKRLTTRVIIMSCLFPLEFMVQKAHGNDES